MAVEILWIAVGAAFGAGVAFAILRHRKGGTTPAPNASAREGEALYRTVLEQTPETVFIQCEGKLVLANPAAAQLLGVDSPDDLIGRDTLDFFHPDSRKSIQERRAQMRATGKPTPFMAHRYIRAGGGEVEIETAATPIMWHGKPASLIVSHNISTRARLERETSDRESRLRLVMDATADAIITIDDAGCIDMFNRAASEIFGYSAEEVRGKNVSMLTTTRDHDHHQGYIDSYIRTGKAKILGIGPREVMGKRKDGSELPLGLSVGKVQIGGKRVFVGALRDLTERREQRAQLVQAQKMEAVGQLTGGIAHDFNNLLSAILGNLELIDDQAGDDPKIKRYIEIAMRATTRGADLTQRLLAFSRRQALSPQNVDVNRMVGAVQDMLARSLGEAIELQTVIGGGLWPASVDPAQLETSILNLAINARDAMPDGGKLTIETANASLDHDYADSRSDVTAGQYVMIAVSDTGEGMTDEVIERAFEPFFTTKEVGKGSGLGLSMVYGFLKQSGGHIAIYSEVGVGTTIRLYLPRGQEGHNVRDRSTATLERPMPGGRERILVVEDDPDVRFYLTTTLGALGYEVGECADGPEALAMLEDWSELDLLFTDVVLPRGMNGRELSEKIRALFPKAKVIFSSGYTENAIVHQGQLDENVDLLTKPYRREVLARRVRKVLDRDD